GGRCIAAAGREHRYTGADDIAHRGRNSAGRWTSPLTRWLRGVLGTVPCAMLVLAVTRDQVSRSGAEPAGPHEQAAEPNKPPAAWLHCLPTKALKLRLYCGSEGVTLTSGV